MLTSPLCMLPMARSSGSKLGRAQREWHRARWHVGCAKMALCGRPLGKHGSAAGVSDCLNTILAHVVPCHVWYCPVQDVADKRFSLDFGTGQHLHVVFWPLGGRRTVRTNVDKHLTWISEPGNTFAWFLATRGRRALAVLVLCVLCVTLVRRAAKSRVCPAGVPEPGC